MKLLLNSIPKRYRAAFLFMNLALLIITYANYKQDTNLRDVNLTDMQAYFEIADSVTFPTEDKPFDDIVVGRIQPTSYQGLALVGPYITVNAGEYDLKISYTSTADVLCEVYSSSVPGENNSAGTVIASTTLPAGSNSHILHYTAEERLRNVEFKFYYNGGELRISSIENQCTRNFTDAFIILALIYFFEILTLFLIHHYRHTGSGRLAPVWNFVILTVLAMIATIPILNNFQASSHDYLFHYARINAITDWFHHISPDNVVMRISGSDHSGYGYITPTMYPQLFLYFPALLRLMGCSMLNAYKILIFFINCGTAYIAYFSYTRIFRSRQIGLLSAALYVMSIYRIADIYTRSAMGEAIAMVFLPLLFYGMYEIIYGDHHRWLYAVLGYTGVIQSHIITVLIAALCCFFAVLFSIRRLIRNRKRLWALTAAAVSTLLLNLWFIVPFLQYSTLELNANEPETRLHSTGIYLSQFFTSFVPNGNPMYDLGSTADEMPLSVGTIVLIGMIFFVYYAFVTRQNARESRRKGLYCFTVGVISLLTASVYFPWKPIIATQIGSHFSIQFLCRLLVLSCVFLSPVTAIGLRYVMFAISSRRNTACMLFLMGIIIFASFYSIDSCLNQESIDKITCEVMEKSDKLYLLRACDPDTIVFNGTLKYPEDMTVQVQNYAKGYLDVYAELSISGSTDSSYIDIPLFCYPNYHVLDQNDQELEFTPSPEGLIRIKPTDSLGRIHVFYREPLLWKICTLVSVLFFVLLCIHRAKTRRLYPY